MSATGKSIVATFKKHPVGFGCVLLCLLMIAAIYHRRAAIPERELALEERTAEGNRLSQNIRNSAQLKEQHDALVETNAEIDDRAVRLASLATNQAYFYTLETETGIKLLDLRQLTPAATARGATAGKHLRVPFAVSVQGDYAKVMNFLRRLESGHHFCRINAASLNGAAEVTLTLSLELLGLP